MLQSLRMENSSHRLPSLETSARPGKSFLRQIPICAVGTSRLISKVAVGLMTMNHIIVKLKKNGKKCIEVNGRCVIMCVKCLYWGSIQYFFKIHSLSWKHCTYHKLFTIIIPRGFCVHSGRENTIYGLSPDVHLWTIPRCPSILCIPGYSDRGNRGTPPSMDYP